jgi:hypothetical protein
MPFSLHFYRIFFHYFLQRRAGFRQGKQAINNMVRQVDLSLDLSSFDDLLGDRGTAKSMKMGHQVCSSMCFAMDGILTTLFSPSDAFGWSSDDNSLVELDPAMTPSPEKPEELRKPLSPRKVCSMWKKKRKEEKQKLAVLQQRSSDLDHELQSETKQNAREIQRSFEKRFDEKDYSQQYERYGSRADFIRDRNL